MWGEHESNLELLQTWLRHSPDMLLASSVDGKIYWANPAFVEWSKWTLSQLRAMTWMDLSEPGPELAADIDALKTLNEYHTRYKVVKRYKVNGEKSQWGELTVMRYPATGDIKICLCRWLPAVNGSAIALATAMETTGRLEQRVLEMTTELKAMTSQTDGRKLLNTAYTICEKHPKAFVKVLVWGIALAASLAGINNAVELMQRIGMMPLPPQKQQSESTTAALQIHQAPSMRELTTPGGVSVSWERYHDARTSRPVLGTAERSGRGSLGIGTGVDSGPGTDRSTHRL